MKNTVFNILIRKYGLSLLQPGSRFLLTIMIILIGAAPLHAQSASPLAVSPSAASGSAQLFSATYSDSNGGSDVAEAVFNIMSNVVPGTPGWSANECLLRYDIATNNIWLVPDAGGTWGGPISAGTSSTLANSQCTVYGSGSFAQLSGTSVTANFLVSFSANFAGAKQLYMSAQDVRGNWSTNYQQQFGSYSVTATASPFALTPNSGNGRGQTFTATYYDPNGDFDIAEGVLNFMSNVVPGSVSGWSANECLLRYDIGTNNIWLVPDAGGTWGGPIVAGGSGVLSNSQCSVYAAGSSVQVSANTATVNFAVTFTAGFAGVKQLYMTTQDARGNWSTNYQQQFGSWSVPSDNDVIFSPIDPLSLIFALPATGGCNNIAGGWTDQTLPQANWALTQNGDGVSGNVSVTNGSCGTSTWQVAGQRTSTASFNLTASNPSPATDGCGNPAAVRVTASVSISGTNCKTGSATETHVFSNSSNTSSSIWQSQDNVVPVATSLSSNLATAPLKTYTGTYVTHCDGSPVTPFAIRWGYQLCITYTVLDQANPPSVFRNSSNLLVSESLEKISGNFDGGAQRAENIPVNADGTLLDELALFNGGSPIPPGKFNKTKQTLTVTDTSTGLNRTVRVNCLSYTSTGVTVTDITSNPNSCTP